MRTSHLAAFIAALAAFVTPLIASATTYNFSVPVRLTGLVNGGAYQIYCSVAANTVTVPSDSMGYGNGNLVSGSYTGTVTVSVTFNSATPPHTYACQLFQNIGGGGLNGNWNPVGPTVTGTM